MVAQPQSQDLLMAIDPELPFLAAKAAVELDNLLLKRPCQQLTSVVLLAKKLEHSSARISGSVSQRKLMDLPDIEVLNNTVHATGNFSGVTLNELAIKASKIAKQLQTVGEKKGESGTIAESRAFCVALSRCASSYMQSASESGYSEHHWS